MLLKGVSVDVIGRTPALDAARLWLEVLGANINSHWPPSGSAAASTQCLVTSDLAAAPARHTVAWSDLAGPGQEWARCGGAWLTDMSPDSNYPNPAIAMRGASLVLELLSGIIGETVRVDGPALLGERASISGLSPTGGENCSGTARIVETADGWLALNLPRPGDVSHVAALIRSEFKGDPWQPLRNSSKKMTTGEIFERTGQLGIPAGRVTKPQEVAFDAQGVYRGQSPVVGPFIVDEAVAAPIQPKPERVIVNSAPATRDRPLRVLELASLWAGPLAGSLFRAAGAEVVKVESARRPDGTRRGPSDFFHLVNGGKRGVTLDFRDRVDVELLDRLISRSDVVIEAMRPSVLERLGIAPTDHAEKGVVWVRLTGFGSSGPLSDRVCFGDDAAVEGGASATHAPDGQPRFIGDALADPVTGLVAAVAAMGGIISGEGHVIDIAMREVVAFALTGFGPCIPDPLAIAQPPRHRRTSELGPELGEHQQWLVNLRPAADGEDHG